MDVDGVDLAALLSEQGSMPLSGLPDDLDDLFNEDLMQFLDTIEGQPAALQCQQKPQPAPAPLVEVTPVALPPVAMSPTPSTSSGCSSGGASPAPAAAAVGPSAAAVALAALQQQMQPGCVIPRLVTTTTAQQAIWTAMLQAACTVAPSLPTPSADEAKARTAPAGTSRQGSRQADSEDSSDTDQDDEMTDSKSKAGNKRKAPDVDWRSIEDPAERRRQRRLAKNRVTAARSRERKKAAWGELEERLKGMESENLQLRAMLEQFARENSSLKNQLLSVARASAGAAGSGIAGLSHVRGAKTADPATILPVFIAIMLVVSALLPGDKACALLGSVLPLALVACMLGAADDSSNVSANPAFDCLFRLMHMLGTLLSKSGRALQRSTKRMLFDRHRYLGRKGMQKLGDSSLFDLLLRDPGIPSLDDCQQIQLPFSTVSDIKSTAEAALVCGVFIKEEPVC